MQNSRILLIGLLLLLTVSCDDDYVYTEPESNVTDQLDTYIEGVRDKIKEKNPNFPGGLALQVIYPGGEAFVSSGLGRNIYNDIHFRAASNTKTLTATAILLLYERGQLDISARITDQMPKSRKTYLPDSPAYDIPFKQEITILQLLQHRAGVFDVSNNDIPDTISVNVPYKGKNYVEYIQQSRPEHTFTFDEIIGVNAICHLYSFRPGAMYNYSNAGYVILGKIIERVSGKTYCQFIRDEILDPMGMNSSYMPESGNDQQLPQPFASGYVQLPEETVTVTESNISANVAEGNLITTPLDLANFLHELIRGNGVLRPSTVNSILLNVLPVSSSTNAAYGCGISYTNNLGYGHVGAHEGYLSQMVCDPQTGITMVIFTNGWDLQQGITSLSNQVISLTDILFQSKQIISDFLIENQH